MRKTSLLAVSLFVAAVFVVSASAQAPAAASKIGLINTLAFADEKAGITKYRTALNSVDAQIKPLNDKLKTSVARYQALGKEIQDSQKNPAIKRETLQPKIDELQALEVQIKRDQEDGKARYSRAYQSTVGPIFNDILKALNEFAKKNGYAVILDGAKLEQAQILLGFDEKYDVTKDFVTYYNTRPAGTATAAAPK